MKKYDDWNEVKKTVEGLKALYFHEREIFYAKIGENIGFEQSGKGDNYERPVLIVKKFNNRIFFGVPLSTTNKTGIFYYSFEFIKRKKSVAILSQLKLIDAKRLDRKIGVMSKSDFKNIKKIISEFFH